MAETVLNLKIIATGKMKDHSLITMVQDYIERISHDARLQVVEIRDSDPESEGRKIAELIKKDPGHTVVLSEEGRQFDSVAFAKYVTSVTGKITFVIGGPTGLSPSVKKSANLLLSLSPMTFTHEIARMLLMEQIYRAVSIIRHRSYHK